MGPGLVAVTLVNAAEPEAKLKWMEYPTPMACLLRCSPMEREEQRLR